MKKLIISTTFVLALLIGTPSAYSAGCSEGVGTYDFFSQTVLSDCPNAAKLRGVCMAIHLRTSDPSPYPNFPHMYQRRILDASCVDVTKDSEEEIASKIQKMWIELEDKLICNSGMFPVPNGNVVKYAVSNSHDQFIADVARWKVNLNRVDPADQLTVLDYVAKEIIKHKGTSLESKLLDYYRTLQRGGAKHKSELDEEKKNSDSKSPTPAQTQ